MLGAAMKIGAKMAADGGSPRGCTRRWLLAGGGWSALVGGLAACGRVAPSPPTAGGPAKERQPVEVWFVATAEDDPWGTTVTRLVNEFDQASQDYKPLITRVPMIAQKVATSVAAGAGPDALRGGTSEMQNYPMAGIAQPLDPFIKGDKSFQPDDVYPAIKQLSTYQDKTYAVSETMIPQAFFLNRDRMRQVGMDVNKLPATLQDWEQAVPPLFTREGAGYRQIGWIPWIPVGQAATHYFAAWGAEWFDPKNEKVTANSPACVQVFEWFRGMAGRYGADAIVDFITRNNANQWGRYTANGPMYDGSIAIFNHSLWEYGSIRQYAPKVDFQLIPMPLAKGATNGRPGVLVANFWFITTPAKNPKGGWEVLKWITVRKESVIALAQLDTLVPSRKSLATAKEFIDFAPWARLFAEEVVPKVKPDYIFASAALLNSQLQVALNNVYQGKAGTREALDDVVRTVQADLDSKKR